MLGKKKMTLLTLSFSRFSAAVLSNRWESSPIFVGIGWLSIYSSQSRNTGRCRSNYLQNRAANDAWSRWAVSLSPGQLYFGCPYFPYSWIFWESMHTSTIIGCIATTINNTFTWHSQYFFWVFQSVCRPHVNTSPEAKVSSRWRSGSRDIWHNDSFLGGGEAKSSV